MVLISSRRFFRLVLWLAPLAILILATTVLIWCPSLLHWPTRVPVSPPLALPKVGFQQASISPELYHAGSHVLLHQPSTNVLRLVLSLQRPIRTFLASIFLLALFKNLKRDLQLEGLTF